jgi:hypothetical protein
MTDGGHSTKTSRIAIAAALALLLALSLALTGCAGGEEELPPVDTTEWVVSVSPNWSVVLYPPDWDLVPRAAENDPAESISNLILPPGGAGKVEHRRFRHEEMDFATWWEEAVAFFTDQAELTVEDGTITSDEFGEGFFMEIEADEADAYQVAFEAGDGTIVFARADSTPDTSDEAWAAMRAVVESIALFDFSDSAPGVWELADEEWADEAPVQTMILQDGGAGTLDATPVEWELVVDEVHVKPSEAESDDEWRFAFEDSPSTLLYIDRETGTLLYGWERADAAGE